VYCGTCQIVIPCYLSPSEPFFSSFRYSYRFIMCQAIEKIFHLGKITRYIVEAVNLHLKPHRFPFFGRDEDPDRHQSRP